MERLAYVRIVPGTKSPRLYERGPRAAEFETISDRPDSDRVVRSGALPGRLHRQVFKWTVENGPAREPAWTQKWRASAVQNLQVDVVHRSKKYRVRETRGKHKRSLSVYAPQEWVSDSGMLDLMERQVLHEVADLLRGFAKEYGYVLAGELVATLPAEVGFSAPELPKFGQPTRDPVWVDGSGTEGNELEMRVGPAARAFLGMPGFMQEATERLKALEQQGGDVRHVLDKLLRLQETAMGLHERQSLAALALTEAQVAAGRPAVPLPLSQASDGSGYT